MILKHWDDLPLGMKNESVKRYHEILSKKQNSLCLKRLFDIFVSTILLVSFLPLFAMISLVVKIDSRGPVFFRQTRITQYGNTFKIFKFRTMVQDADQIGSLLTAQNDSRVTRIGKALRKFRFDELPQLINVIRGEMTFVGTRPEVAKYVSFYSDEMMATLLLPAGITSEASISFKDEKDLLKTSGDLESIYIYKILPQKMKLNLMNLEEFSLWNDVIIMFRTVLLFLIKEKTGVRNGL